MKAWRLILVPFLITLLRSVPPHSKEKFLWAINPEVHESKKLYRDAERTVRAVKTIKALGRRASASTKFIGGQEAHKTGV